MTTTTTPEVHKLGCNCETCYAEFRARWTTISEEQAREVFQVGARAIRAQLANRPGAIREARELATLGPEIDTAPRAALESKGSR